MVEVIYDKSKASSQSTVKLEDGKFVRAENVVAVAGEGGGGGGASSAADVSFNPSGLNVITGTNVQSALAQVDSSVKDLQDSVSVLTTSANLLNEIGGKTTVALGNLTAMNIYGRPSYKQAGATVYDGNGVVGIIGSVDSTNAVITTVQYGVGDIAAVLNAINGENI